jgi:Male sterility protein
VSTLVDLFSHFTKNEWIYESVKLNDYIKLLTAEEKKEFQIDVKTINWEIAVWRYGYGV